MVARSYVVTEGPDGEPPRACFRATRDWGQTSPDNNAGLAGFRDADIAAQWEGAVRRGERPEIDATRWHPVSDETMDAERVVIDYPIAGEPRRYEWWPEVPTLSPRDGPYWTWRDWQGTVHSSEIPSLTLDCGGGLVANVPHELNYLLEEGEIFACPWGGWTTERPDGDDDDDDEEGRDDGIFEYHDSHRPWNRTTVEGEVYGVELEVYAPDRGDFAAYARDLGFLAERDSSLCEDHGVEIIGAPLHFESYYQVNGPWIKLLSYARTTGIRGWRAGCGYGIHVNINRRG